MEGRRRGRWMELKKIDNRGGSENFCSIKKFLLDHSIRRSNFLKCPKMHPRNSAAPPFPWQHVEVTTIHPFQSTLGLPQVLLRPAITHTHCMISIKQYLHANILIQNKMSPYSTVIYSIIEEERFFSCYFLPSIKTKASNKEERKINSANLSAL